MSDLISKEALKQEVKHRYVLSPLDAPWPLVYRNTDLPEIIDQMPTIEAEPIKHGRWIYKGDTGWHCSECDVQAPFWCFASTQNLSAYCPNCGAKMDEVAP